MSLSLGRRPRTHVLAVALLVAFLVAFGGPVAAHTGDAGAHHHDGWMPHGGAVDNLWTPLLLVVLVGLGTLLLARRDADGDATDEAIDVLRRRYAEGEIDEAEFETRRRKLQGGE